MTKAARRAAGRAMVVALMGWTSSAVATKSAAAVASEQWLMAPDARVRGASPRIVAVIIEAATQSMTFRGLVDRIGSTDGIVYVAEGPCGHAVHACLLFTITMTGPNRMLRIHVDQQKSNRDLMGSIGHELQHAVEALSNRTVRNDRQMYTLYFANCRGCGGAIETHAAIRAGSAVGEELRKSAAAERRE